MDNWEASIRTCSVNFFLNAGGGQIIIDIWVF
jgi:hypothetical protein